MADIEALFAVPGYYDETPVEEVTALDGERTRLAEEIERSAAAWDEIERALDALANS